jgi:dihydrofolate reductase
VSFDVVVAVDRDWGIGKAGALPWPKLRGDLQHFKRVTTTTSDPARQNAVIMGRKTWESREVAGKPLPNRRNVVVSRRADLAAALPDGVLAASSLDDALGRLAHTPGIETSFVVGGAELYVLALAHPALRWIYLTRVDGRFDCDARIPDLEALGMRIDPAWPAQDGCDNDVRYRIERWMP